MLIRDKSSPSTKEQFLDGAGAVSGDQPSRKAGAQNHIGQSSDGGAPHSMVIMNPRGCRAPELWLEWLRKQMFYVT